MCFGLETNLCNHLTSAATLELVPLVSLLQDFMPSVDQDARFLIGGHVFSAKKSLRDNTMGT